MSGAYVISSLHTRRSSDLLLNGPGPLVVSTAGSLFPLSSAAWAAPTIAFTVAWPPAGAPRALISSIWRWTDGMIVVLANVFNFAWLGFPPLFGNSLLAALPICRFPRAQIALPSFRNCAFVMAGVEVLLLALPLLLLLLPQPAARPTVRTAMSASTKVGRGRIETSLARCISAPA